jgi:RNase P/RNase MRP subunit POP5
MLQTKALRPSHREKKRYIVYEVQPQCDMHKLQKELIDELHTLLGVFMSAQAGILPVTVNQSTQRGVLRVNHTAVDHIKACFVMISHLQKQSVQLRSITVSGVLKKAKLKLNGES